MLPVIVQLYNASFVSASITLVFIVGVLVLFYVSTMVSLQQTYEQVIVHLLLVFYETGVCMSIVDFYTT
jgi:hypothetical protein